MSNKNEKMAAVKANAQNIAVDNANEKNNHEDLEKIIIATPIEEDASPYKFEGELAFEIGFIDDGNFNIAGQMTCNILLDNTELKSLETWRYIIEDINVTNIFCSSTTDAIVYAFTAKSFNIKA